VSLIAAILAILGCSTPHSTSTETGLGSTSVQQREKIPLEIWQFAGNGGDWLFIPRRGSLDSAPYGYLAEVRVAEHKFSTNRIRVVVQGEVKDPGEIVVGEGTTVLEAVARAGSFTDWASVNRVGLTRNSIQHPLRLRGRNGGAPVYRQVWYIDSMTGTNAIKTSTKPWEVSDIVLEDGDKVYVPRRGL